MSCLVCPFFSSLLPRVNPFFIIRKKQKQAPSPAPSIFCISSAFGWNERCCDARSVFISDSALLSKRIVIRIIYVYRAYAHPRQTHIKIAQLISGYYLILPSAQPCMPSIMKSIFICSATSLLRPCYVPLSPDGSEKDSIPNQQNYHH